MTDPKNGPRDMGSKSKILFKGSCACQRMTYHCTAMPTTVQACHCVICRKLSGGPYQPFADVDKNSLTLFDNQEHLRYEGLPRDNVGGIVYFRSSHVGERAFCASCHAALAMRFQPRPDIVGVTLGSVDPESIANETVRSSLKLREHIFVSQKFFWTELGNDGLPAYERFAPDTAEALDDRIKQEK